MKLKVFFRKNHQSLQNNISKNVILDKNGKYIMITNMSHSILSWVSCQTKNLSSYFYYFFIPD